MMVEQQADQSIIGQTALNVGTHSKLVIKIKNDFVTAWIDYNSITGRAKQVFPMKEGFLTLDKGAYK